MKEKRGITLISLIITIIILIILAGVSINLLFEDNGLIEKTKTTKTVVNISNAQERLEIIKASVLTNKYQLNLNNYIDEIDRVKDENNIGYIEKINDVNAEVIVDGKYKFLIIDEENGNIKIEYKGMAGRLELSSNSGTYTYPNLGTFNVIKNESGGMLSVKSENENIVKAEISGTTITVIPQTNEGIAKITVISAANGNYGEGKVTYTATVENKIVYLYHEGDECTDITGGWEEICQEYSGTGEKRETYLYCYSPVHNMVYSTYYFKTVNKIDISIYKTLYFDMEHEYYTDDGDGGHGTQIGTWDGNEYRYTHTGWFMGPLLLQGKDFDEEPFERQTIGIDIRNINESLYLTGGIYNGGANDSVSIKIYNVWLEK